ncbi:MAG: class I SAM-dependent methyltransferase [Chloroflexi bacterium]|nr:class I SAM-dependent methyltransferase [Chloroflexota bacterium]
MSESLAEQVKQCCADLYGGDWARFLLGDSLHPGGLDLTLHLAKALELDGSARLLDAACGTGASSVAVADRFGCRVVGLDYGTQQIEAALAAARKSESRDRVGFLRGDVERLPFADGAFDAALCECALSTFGDKPGAARELRRVLKRGGGLGFSDVTRSGPLPEELRGPLTYGLCLAEARPTVEYAELLEASGFRVLQIEDQRGRLIDILDDVKGKLIAADLLCGLGVLRLPEIDLAVARQALGTASGAIADGAIGYVAIVAVAG